MPIENQSKVLEVIAATGSERRRKMMADLMAWIEEHGYSDYEIVVHNLSPDKDAGVDESDSAESTVVAWEKALVVALSLGLLETADISEDKMKEWADVIRFVGPMKPDKEHKTKTLIFGGDVVTAVSPSPLREDVAPRELLKVERDLQGKSSDEQAAILAKDLEEIKKLYCSPEGFIVFYNIGIALLSKDDVGDKRGIVAGWEVKIKFKPLPEELIEGAYKIGPNGEKLGSAFQVGPRVDLATLAMAKVEGTDDYKHLDVDYGIWVRNVNSPEDQFLPIQVEVMRGLVVGGLLPPHLCLELLAALDEQEPQTQPLEPRQIKLEIGVEAMLEKFKPVLDSVKIETIGDSRVIQFPDKKEPGSTTDISLDDEGKLTSIGELILKVAVLRLVDQDQTMADAAMRYLQTRLGI